MAVAAPSDLHYDTDPASKCTSVDLAFFSTSQSQLVGGGGETCAKAVALAIPATQSGVTDRRDFAAVVL